MNTAINSKTTVSMKLVIAIVTVTFVLGGMYMKIDIISEQIAEIKTQLASIQQHIITNKYAYNER